MAETNEISGTHGENNQEGTRLSQDVIRSPEAKNIEKDTQNKLKELQESLRKGEMSISLTKGLLESLKEISSENRAFILAGILGKLNKRGISVLGIRNEQIELGFGKENIIGKPNVATRDEVVSYQNIFNNYLSGGFFTVPDFHKALLYRTTGIESYINEKIEGQKLSTHEYALRLLEKYNISVVAYGENKEDISSKRGTAQYFDGFFKTQGQYLAFKADIKKIITDNQSDKEFLITYFDDIYYKQGKNTDDASVEKFQKATDKNERELIKSLNTLSDTEKYALGVRDSNEAKELAKQWKNDPAGAIFDALQNGGAAFGLIGALIGLLWGKKGVLIGGGLGFLLGGGGTAFASEMMKGIGKDTEDKPSSVPSSNQAEVIGNQSIYNKFETIVKGINTDTKEQEKNLEVWETLSSNDVLMKTPLTELQEILKDETKTQKFFLDSCSFDASFLLTNKNRIKNIYETLLRERERSIGNFNQNETLKEYLKRTGSVVAAGVGASPTLPTLAANQRLDSNGNILTGEFKGNNLVNGERRNKEDTKIETFKDGKLVFTYEGEYINGKFNGIVKYNDGTGKVEIYENGEKVDYTLEYVGGLVGLLGLTLAPSAAGPVGVAASGVLGVGYSVVDLFNQDEDFLWDILKTAHIVDPRFEGGQKTFWDNAFAAMGLVPGMRQVGLTAKIASYTSKLPPDKLAKVTEISGKVMESLKNSFKVGEKASEVIVKNFGIADDIVNGLKTGETTVQKMKIGGEVAEVTFKKSSKGELFIQEIKKSDGTSVTGLKGISEFCKGKKYEVVKNSSGVIDTSKGFIKGLFENREIGKNIKALEEGKSIKIGETTFTKLKNGKYGSIINGETKEWTYNQTLKFISELPSDVKKDFVLSTKLAKVFEKEFGKIRKIDGHDVEILANKTLKVRSTNGTILEGDALADFTTKNADKLSKSFTGLSISEGGVKIKEGIATGYEKYGIKTIWDYLEKAGFKDGSKSKLFSKDAKPIDALGGIILTPATTIRQLISAVPNKEYENIFRILISGNKNIEVWGGIGKSAGVSDFLSKVGSSGIVRAGTIYGVTQIDDLTTIDENKGKIDEIGDYGFYAYGGIINTILAKILN